MVHWERCFGNFLGIMGVMYVVISYLHASNIGIDYVYPGRFEKHFYALMYEYGFGWFMIIHTVYNYCKAAFGSAHASEPLKNVKLSQQSFKHLIKMNEDHRSYREAHEKDVKYDPIVEDYDEFKDNYKFGLYCKKCEIYRYPRAHHCSNCRTCSAFLDHHCAIINNCVGYNNLRYFIRFSIYGSTLCLYYLYLVKGLAVHHMFNIGSFLLKFKFQNFPVFDIAILFWFNIILLVAFLQIFILSIVMNRCIKGQTGLEKWKNAEDFTYDLGFDQNWEFIFGKRKYFSSKIPVLSLLCTCYNKISWMFFWHDDNNRNLERDMKKYFGFELADSQTA
ncbi:unnamed protein product [Moneuplotes crassus]|uniref:Palmitoyltransferase n=2 Tax=Euplotes crassus TaxID=5936 RepID=A0AAD1XKL8_EUPCR|nr:unnamed protein product [Moneuplotes crassus]